MKASLPSGNQRRCPLLPPRADAQAAEFQPGLAERHLVDSGALHGLASAAAPRICQRPRREQRGARQCGGGLDELAAVESITIF